VCFSHTLWTTHITHVGLLLIASFSPPNPSPYILPTSASIVCLSVSLLSKTRRISAKNIIAATSSPSRRHHGLPQLCLANRAVALHPRVCIALLGHFQTSSSSSDRVHAGILYLVFSSSPRLMLHSHHDLLDPRAPAPGHRCPLASCYASSSSS
jgi:hypothetical protein